LRTWSVAGFYIEISYLDGTGLGAGWLAALATSNSCHNHLQFQLAHSGTYAIKKIKTMSVKFII